LVDGQYQVIRTLLATMGIKKARSVVERASGKAER
jgi:hypothetical protein